VWEGFEFLLNVKIKALLADFLVNGGRVIFLPLELFISFSKKIS